jgi:SAM-dependent methyltransferase
MMPSIEWNRQEWNQYQWPQGGDEWSSTWGGSGQIWWGVLFPRIGRFLPAASILEIAPGFGRWTHYLQQFTERYIGVDLAEAAVDACRKEFPNLPFHVNDGRSLPMIPTRSIDFCFSYDSLVHVDSDTMRAYVAELNRILTDTGLAFLHHSNAGAYDKRMVAQRRWARFIPSWRVRQWLKLNPWLHRRDPQMTADRMRSYCESQGLYCRQELITWIETGDAMTDCFTLVSRAPMVYARWENRDFEKFAGQLKACSDLYRP